MRNMKALLMGSVAIAAMGVASESAQAQSLAFGAGATFPQVLYRQLADCVYSQAQGSSGKPGPSPLATGCSGFNTSGFGGVLLYAATGSGNGKLVYRTNDKTQIGTPSSSAPAYTSSNWGVNGTADYDGVQFVGSDDVITASDVSLWNTGGTTSPQSKFGNIIAIPAVIGAIGLGFNGKDGTGAALNILPATPTGGSSGLNLSRNAFCGIASGHITKWNNSILTALNGGVLGTGNITVVHRQDGSGSTFLFSNAMVEQCRYEFGPNNESDATVVSYAFPWTDHSQACTTPLLARGANQLNWPDQFPTDQCGTAVANTGGGTFTNASGSGALVSLVTSTNGAIGYASADFWLPAKVGGLKTANLQSQWDITASTGKFQPPTPAGAQKAMSSAIPQMDATTRSNPLTWSLQGVNPNPVVSGAYPISGFSWIFLYQCYQTHANTNNAYIWTKTWLDFVYGTGAAPIFNSNAFAQVPAIWQTEIYTLLNDSTNGLQGSGCSGKVGAY
ncbi:substrate-binding domain-containing protein [Bradyrhizobium diazoefficiens]|jgi:phosphate transport system substrate-binding protein|nr:substrate-binding domain-containing protein [Bradyrhizobium diazoefficiens]UCF51050.1 MAG: substrate-binding domain-containing protein [Bradyrhizobium sp.]MBR0964136.1 substrate-binding domain-containing protein [Bradyrhizobium diazoefficiens]MBR0978296.1 substrate-binding domain-containing protein [Bradyrhizobium diazoefficiens]MBR1006227.1 substrate-binding domain-containing protein [Bradyrhizobium diazoefficiens]MBR1014279.1 substrate-binding domain-containing protein [Bradyrhizobium dia